ncbi:T9SS type A sorting domain-containing protein [Portibacter marinus]|uniref:T9SS type A sorting domain-containing protein n=1 Tax=Portibacter marinus TaxID=2898660 RepID=UPI001F3E9945|nr:T9SS type A sorting domain-containing protein [Portibacter marinus]
MKKLIVLCLLSFPVLLLSQEWFEEGDQWIHQIPYGYFGGVSGFESITVNGDTVLSGENYKILEGVKALYVIAGDTLFEKSPKYFLRESKDSVFHFYKGKEHLIYDFTMEVGDSIKWFGDEIDPNCPAIFKIDSIFTTMVDGIEVMVQQGVVRKEYAYAPRGLRIYKGIGVVQSKFNYEGASWNVFGFLLPSQGITCLLDYSPPYLCNFVRDSINLKEADLCYEISASNHQWISSGGKWVYTFGGGLSPTTHARVLEWIYPSDTIINETPFYKLSNTVVSLKGESELVYAKKQPYLLRQKGRKLYYWTGDTSHLVYDFDMRIGDTLEYHPLVLDEFPDPENCRSYFVLDSVRIDRKHYPPIQVQMGRIVSEFWGSFQFVEIYESIGIVRRRHKVNDSWLPGQFLIPEMDMSCFFCDCEGQGDFCSYEGSLDSSIPSNPDDANCFDLVSSTSPGSLTIPKINLLQNPVEDILILEGDIHDFDDYQIFSINGRFLLDGKMNGKTIDIQNLNPGIYLLGINGNQRPPTTLKFIKV